MSNPLVSIVTGTYNRLVSLQRMVASARATLPPGVPHEFVLVDGGSTDGTLEWCRVQADVHLIEHGELKGAIPAFCDGAKAARGTYVIMGNDDVTFGPDAIMRAIVHLETNPRCGAVAFADNRPAPGYSAGYHVQVISAQDGQGRQISVPYAQVGLFRRWLGDQVGWWGMDDPIMRDGHTYGGDNYLSARIWELGYTVDVVPGVYIDDHIVRDALRERNWNEEQKRPAMYYKRYPNGPRIPHAVQVENSQTEQMRVLYLPIFEPGNPIHRQNKRGLRDALARRFLLYELDYMNTRFDLPELVGWFRPHLLLLQLHGADQISAATLIEARNRMPGMVAVNWNGDAHLHGLTSPAMLDLLRNVDLQLVVNAAALPVYEREGIPAAYWQIGYEEPAGKLPRVPAHDVVFLGNNYNKSRSKLGTALRKLPFDVGLYGMGWEDTDGNTLYDFAAGEALYRNAKIAISDTFHGETKAFVSNRLFQALAAGVFVLQELSDGLDEFTGLQDGEHYVSWRTLSDLREKVHFWLAEENAGWRDQIRTTGQAFVREHFSFDAQVRKLFFELLPMIKETERAAS